ncbi:LADA_0G07910g1_1 [Lachancea dasiensis]|uniref:LADA_0G07910g1_1 n=1 Tax=Lachancea dasiensis TaxID=1072105 RepID=A0A1G4JTV7_9SACH|nr:LADA_0G07910g1_1 [Lachancea dasiensis]
MWVRCFSLFASSVLLLQVRDSSRSSIHSLVKNINIQASPTMRCFSGLLALASVASQVRAVVSNSSSAVKITNNILSTTTGNSTSYSDSYVFLSITEIQLTSPVNGITFEIDPALGGVPSAVSDGGDTFKFEYGTAVYDNGNVTVNFTSVPPSGRYNLTFPCFIGQDSNQEQGQHTYQTEYGNEALKNTIDYVAMPSDTPVFNSIEYDAEQEQAYFYLNIPKAAYLGGFTFNTTGPKEYSYISDSFDFGFVRTPDGSDSFNDPANTASTLDSVYPQYYTLDTASGGVDFRYNGSITTETTSEAGSDISYIGAYIKFEVTPPTGTNVFELDATLAFSGNSGKQDLTYSFKNYGYGPGFLDAVEIPSVSVSSGSSDSSSSSSSGSSTAPSSSPVSGSSTVPSSSSLASSSSTAGVNSTGSSGSSTAPSSSPISGSSTVPSSSSLASSSSTAGFNSTGSSSASSYSGKASSSSSSATLSSAFGSTSASYNFSSQLSSASTWTLPSFSPSLLSSATWASSNASQYVTTATTEDISTTVITTCPICTGKDKTTVVQVSTITTTESGLVTEYTTFCPLSATETSLSISSGSTVSPSVAISEVSSGVYTVYTTYCPYGSTSGLPQSHVKPTSTAAEVSEYEGAAVSVAYNFVAMIFSFFALI